MSDPRPPAGDTRPTAGDFRPLACDPEAISFYIAANDQELLRQVRSIMQQAGLVGIADTAGRLHYIVDGSRGTPYATRRILETTNRCSAERGDQARMLGHQLPDVIGKVLDRCGIRHELKGRIYLEHILHLAVLDERRLKPLSKTLYPDVARHFKSRSSQVERDIRYTFSCASPEQPWPESLGTGNTARISYLCSEIKRELRQLDQGEPESKPAAMPVRPGVPPS